MTHLVQFMPDERKLMTWAANHDFMASSDLGYGLHGILGAAFGDMAPKTFAWLDALKGHRRAHLLAYSAHSAEELREQAGFFGEPLALDALCVTQAASKVIPEFKSGQRLGFELVTRPVLRSSVNGNGKRQVHELDAYLHARKMAMRDGRDPDAIQRDDVYCDWIDGRLSDQGVDVQSVRVIARRQVAVARRARPRDDNRTHLRAVDGQEVRFDGVIEVADPKGFASALPKGVGRHRSFGYGMLVLRPAGSRTVSA